MTATIRFAEGLNIPLDAITKTHGIFAQRRKGKTYTASVMAEEFVDVGLPFVVLDPTGAWWGLRASADGEGPGLPVVVIGGAHGDVPLERASGKLLADLMVDEPGWYVIDLSLFESKEADRQFATDFAERLYRRKGQPGCDSPLHVFIDEADVFAPQRSPSGDQRMLGAFEAMVRRGGIRGIGTTLITQRAAVINKNVFEELDALIILRIVGPNDRKAVDDYIKAYATPEQRGEILGSLASLDIGEAWYYEPGENLLQRVRIRERRTFNSSATPKAGERRAEPRRLAEVDLAALKERMAATIEKAKADDPRELRKRISELERTLTSSKQLNAQSPEPEVCIERVEVPVFSAADEERIAGLEATLTGIAGKLGDIAADVALLRSQVREARQIEHGKGGVVGTRRETGGQHDVGRNRQGPQPEDSGRSRTRDDERPREAARSGGQRLSPSRVVPAVIGTDGSNPSVALSKAERAILTALAQNPEGLTRQPLAILTGYAYSGGFRNSLSSLRTNGYIEGLNNSWITITETGFGALGDYDELPTGQALLDYWLADSRLGKAEKAVLNWLADHHPTEISGTELAPTIGYEYSGGFRNALSKLRTLGLIEGPNAGVKASDVFFVGVT